MTKKVHWLRKSIDEESWLMNDMIYDRRFIDRQTILVVKSLLGLKIGTTLKSCNDIEEWGHFYAIYEGWRMKDGGFDTD